jgi:brefeldin A-inhibited guanine nucleotide-exchange protein
VDDAELSERLHSNGSAPVVDEAANVRAAVAVAAFVDLFNVWGHASSALLEAKDKKAQASFADLQVAILDCASNLAAYGCLEGVHLNLQTERHAAAQMLASSVFNSDLSLERVELAAMKFLLGTGLQQNLLRGSYMLQSIRTLYHVYLTTESRSNKTTARAALQQLVTSVFTKVVNKDTTAETAEQSADAFPSEDHRDAFLVLRSICKLSMRNLPEADGMHSHIGLQTSASNETWDGERLRKHSERQPASNVSGSDPSSHDQREHAQLVYTSAIHPALESKLLALELILYVLQNTKFSVEFSQNCGPQFHAAIRNYLCVSLLKNCTSDTTRVVNLSLRIFVPVVRNFRTILKNEIEAFVTNVFFVILDSKNSPAEHKGLVVNTFNEICSDPSTLAEIFLNYDCDLSAVDLFHRIVNTLSRLSRTGLQESRSSGMSSFMGGPTEAQMEKFRSETRVLRLDAMRALRQILASLHSSIVEPLNKNDLINAASGAEEIVSEDGDASTGRPSSPSSSASSPGKQSLVEIYGSKKKRRAEESEAILRFNQKPSAGIAYAAKCKHIDPEDPVDVARYLLKNKDEFDKTQIGEYLGREAEYQGGFSIRVLHEYARLIDFAGLP